MLELKGVADRLAITVLSGDEDADTFLATFPEGSPMIPDLDRVLRALADRHRQKRGFVRELVIQ